MNISRLSLLLVVVIDVMGYGLILPIFNTILLDPDQSFLPHDTSAEMRQFKYGLVIAVFFLFYFLGAAFIAKMSDYIGRKRGILICLTGALIGYALTLVSLYASSFLLLVLGRAISGFTTANQPIAQAALIDISNDDQEKSKNLGLIVAASALGLLGGPLISGILSDKALLGSLASPQLPFYAAVGLILINMALIMGFFFEPDFKRKKIDVHLTDVFTNLWRVRENPTVLRLALVLLFALMGLNAFFFFLDTYMLIEFKFDTLQNSLALTVFGGAMAFGSGVLTAPLHERFDKIRLLYVTIAGMGAGILAFILNPIASLSYVIIIPITICFAIMYPTMLALFSGSVGPTEQGWVMGLTVAVYALGSGSITAVGGTSMHIDTRMPFFLAIGCCLIAIGFMLILFQTPAIRKLGKVPKH
ncbi:MFS transporter [Ruegeria lacuscaerulensis]|uniref:MFS transporter n=1 Tax=Ruegeria lacuscaerulensis TaxID=55218 RepID=UPI00147A71AB|nr:MFS transporter [Ruegeria lacuscaerulensis]